MSFATLPFPLVFAFARSSASFDLPVLNTFLLAPPLGLPASRSANRFATLTNTGIVSAPADPKMNNENHIASNPVRTPSQIPIWRSTVSVAILSPEARVQVDIHGTSQRDFE